MVDDGIATGLTMLAAIELIRKQRPAKIIVAIPVVPADTATIIEQAADKLVAVAKPVNYLGSVGVYYQNFPQLDDREVLRLIKPSWR